MVLICDDALVRSLTAFHSQQKWSDLFTDATFAEGGLQAKLSAPEKITGDASICVVRGKKRYLFDFNFTLPFEISTSGGGKYTGSYTMNDISNDEDYEVRVEKESDSNLTRNWDNSRLLVRLDLLPADQEAHQLVGACSCPGFCRQARQWTAEGGCSHYWRVYEGISKSIERARQVTCVPSMCVTSVWTWVVPVCSWSYWAPATSTSGVSSGLMASCDRRLALAALMPRWQLWKMLWPWIMPYTVPPTKLSPVCIQTLLETEVEAQKASQSYQLRCSS